MTAVLPELPELPDASRSLLRALPIPDTEPRPDRDPYLASRVGSGSSRDAALPRMRQRTLALALVTTPDEPPIELALRPLRPAADRQRRAARARSLGSPDGPGRDRGPHRRTSARPAGPVDQRRRVRRAAPSGGAAAVRPASGPARHGAQRAGLPAGRRHHRSSAVVVGRGRVRAVALRLEGLDGRWRMTALELG